MFVVHTSNCHGQNCTRRAIFRLGIDTLIVNILVNIVIVKLRDSFVGCSINNIFIVRILYADDITVLSATVSGLQEMLNICNKTILDMDLSFNCKKSVCIRFGPVCKHTVTDMYIRRRR